METHSLLNLLYFGAIIGAFGQGLRVIVGLRKAKDEATQTGLDFRSECFDLQRLLVSLMIGAIAGGLGALILQDFKPIPADQIRDSFFKLLAIGYAGTDFIEGFIGKYLPKKETVVARGSKILVERIQPEGRARGPAHLLAADEARTAVGQVETACQSRYPAGKADCNKFAKLVAADFGLKLEGDANEIARQISRGNAASNGWTYLGDGADAGVKAAKAAARGELVLGARDEGNGNHGHVVVVVSGPLAHGSYPRAYWGTLNYRPDDPETWGLNKTVNFAWGKNVRDQVTYASRAI